MFNREKENLPKETNTGRIEVGDKQSVTPEKFIQSLFQINPEDIEKVEEGRMQKAKKFPEIIKRPLELRAIFYDAWLKSHELSPDILEQKIKRKKDRLEKLNVFLKKDITEKRKEQIEKRMKGTKEKLEKLQKFVEFPDDAEVFRERQKYLKSAFERGELKFEDTLPARYHITYKRIKKWEKKHIKLYKYFLEEIRNNPNYEIKLNPEGREIVEYDEKEGFFCDHNGKKYFLTLGDIFSDYIWGIKYIPSDKMSAETKKYLLKHIVKNEFRKGIERVRDFGGEYAAGRILRNPPRSLFELNSNKPLKFLDGFVFEMIMREFMERISYLLNEKGFIVKVLRSSLEEDMDDKIDFKIKILREEGEVINLGIQVKTNKKRAGTIEKITAFLNDYKRATNIDAIKILSLRDFKWLGLEYGRTLYEKWKEAGSPPGGPEAFIPIEAQEAIIRKIIDPYITENELSNEDLRNILRKDHSFRKSLTEKELEKIREESFEKKPAMLINEKAFTGKYLREHLMETGISIDLIKKCLYDGTEVTDEFGEAGKGARYFKIKIPGAGFPGRIVVPNPDFGEPLSGKITNWTADCELKIRHGELRPIMEREQLPKWLLDCSSDFYVIVEKNQLPDGRLQAPDEPTEDDPEGSWTVVTAHFGPPSFRKPKVPNKKDCANSQKIAEYLNDLDRYDREKPRTIFIDTKQTGPLEKSSLLIEETQKTKRSIAETQKKIDDLRIYIERIKRKLNKINK